MFNWMKICFTIWSFHQIFGKVDAECELNFHYDSLKPLIFRQFGSKVLLLRQSLTNLKLYENDSIEAFCSNGFTINGNYIDNKYKKLVLQCHADRLVTNSNPSNEFYGSTDISCQSDVTQHIYESETHLADCPTTSSMLVLGAQYIKDIKTAAFCYDCEELQIKYIAYTAYNTKLIFDKENYSDFSANNLKITELDTLRLDKVLMNFETYFNFMSAEQFSFVLKSLEEGGDIEPNSDLFAYDSLIQDEAFSEALKPYQNVFSIVWYKNLLYGNWRNFLKALNAHVADGSYKYEVRLGISNNIELPSSGGCNKTKPLTFTYTLPNEKSHAKAPKYIWAHFRALTVSPTVANVNRNRKSFVIVGFNSPYTLTSEPTSFCENICHQLPWLAASKFGNFHMIPRYGVVICCRAADVAHKLDNFPSKHIWWQSDDERDITSITEKSTTLPITEVTRHANPIFLREYSAENSIGSGSDIQNYNDDTE